MNITTRTKIKYLDGINPTLGIRKPTETLLHQNSLKG